MQLDDSAQRAARRFSFPPISIEDVDDPIDDATRVIEDQDVAPANDDGRPRKQSRKQKRRRRRNQQSDTPEGVETDAAPSGPPEDSPDESGE
tara:strand:+ start:657 stop:932 length:276 start_codon:yes stop_codon:yes gene_type:complete